MGFDWTEFIYCHRTNIIDEWVHRLHTEVSRQYAERPKEELFETVAQAFDANCRAIVHDDYHLVDRFIGNISRMRLAGGFPANDVLKAFELFRNILTPLLFAKASPSEFFDCMAQVNECLAYTIYCFSDLFQELHKQSLVEYTRRLEADVKARTSELQESELKYKTLIEEINDGYVVLQEGMIVFVNQAFCNMHGYSREEILGKGFERLIDPKDRGILIDLCKGESSERKHFSPLEYCRLTKGGKSLPTEITVKSTCYDHSQSTIGICRDITERVMMETKFREAERMAYIGRITTSLSHEIRNPLSAVKMNLQIFRKNNAFQGNDRRRLDISVREVQRLECILEELLDFAKPLTLKRSLCNLNRILPSCIELLEGRLDEKSLSISLSLDPDMPNIFADTHKLEQAIMNLLINAVDASEPRAEIFVISRSHPDDSPPKVELCVVNQGIILEEVLPEIFKPFFTTKLKGTGLGLTNVKRVAEAHGGSVSVEHEGKNRTVFRVHLPAGSVYG